MSATQHPDLAAALDPFDPGAVIGIALRARAAQDDGRYCECVEPLTAGADLMCGACLLNNRNQELRHLDASCGPHAFEPGAMDGAFCAICTHLEEKRWHHGEPRPARTSWGEDYTPGSAGLPPLADDEIRRYGPAAAQGEGEQA